MTHEFSNDGMMDCYYVVEFTKSECVRDELTMVDCLLAHFVFSIMCPGAVPSYLVVSLGVASSLAMSLAGRPDLQAVVP